MDRLRKELDRSIVTGQGIEYHAIPSGKFRRELSLRNISDLGRVASAYFRARALLKISSIDPIFQRRLCERSSLLGCILPGYSP